MGNRIISIVLSILLFSFVFCYIFIRGSDELEIQRLVQSNTQSEQSIILLLENHGLRDIELINVSINKSAKPDHIEISLINSLTAIRSASFDDAQSVTSEIKTVKLKPRAKTKEKVDNEKDISSSNYYLRIESEEKIKSIYIKYKYIGMFFIKEINLKSLKTFEG
ncbi:hypothetical protein [Cohnella yongneupensis]|uniref:Lipoprotein n=1 Tax=Cohnella yongneupensis TaxID=425006 RepID=A0ABW0QUN7_9BACL